MCTEAIAIMPGSLTSLPLDADERLGLGLSALFDQLLIFLRTDEGIVGVLAAKPPLAQRISPCLLGC